MDHRKNTPSLVIFPSPARPLSVSPVSPSSHYPFRPVAIFNQGSQSSDNEKSIHQTHLSELVVSDHLQQSPSHMTLGSEHRPRSPTRPFLPAQSGSNVPASQHVRPSLRTLNPTHSRGPAMSQTYARPRGLRISNLVKPWIPLIMYGFTSLAFLVAMALWRTEVFECLDRLSYWLQTDEQFGHAVLFLLIFLTTFPPIPLYSTLIILAGYTFGPWTGAIISYFAALSGALTVFILSRFFFRDAISRWLSCTISIKRVVRAIEKRPKLLFLIRLAPYPYNVMNCLLAASPTLTLHTYTFCTALSLFKVIIHTSLGASIHSFKDYHVVQDGENSDEQSSANTVARMSTIIGVILCVAIFIYLSVVARRAIDDELDEPVESEETVGFLSACSRGDLEEGGYQHMLESPFRTQQLVVPFRLSDPQGHRRCSVDGNDGW